MKDYKFFNTTKYGVLYIKIIEKAKNESRSKQSKSKIGYTYYESHHILPKSLFKEYSILKYNPWNKVLLTAREHFICHILLMKHYRKMNDINADIKMSKALKRLSEDGKHNSRVYQNLKLNLSCSEETKIKIGVGNKGKIPTKEARLKMSKASLGKPKSESHRQNMKKPKTKEHGKNIGKANNNIIEIYDNFGNLQFVNDINFFEFCKIYNLPGKAFKTSYLNDSRRLYSTRYGEIQAIKNNTIQFKGWYAKKIIK